jgi:hypothetical protein
VTEPTAAGRLRAYAKDGVPNSHLRADLIQLLDEHTAFADAIARVTVRLSGDPNVSAMINKRQVLGLLSATWPNGNYEAPAPASDTCAHCGRDFGLPYVTRHADTPFCADCVSDCHEADAGHRCQICVPTNSGA